MRLKRWADTAFQATCAFLMISMVLVTLLQVIGRFVLQSPFEWTEELARLNLVYLTFLGSVVAFQLRNHLKIDTVVHLLPPIARRWLRILVDLASMVVMGVIVWNGAPLLIKFSTVLTASLGWPTTVAYFPVVFGSFSLMIYFGIDVVDALRRRDETQEVLS
ncbi:MAG TPA: TRAP transporter small permease [Chloroflexota bacterium]|nr:TRAP transporter small permease [Chloroflexota bacterium]